MIDTLRELAEKAIKASTTWEPWRSRHEYQTAANPQTILSLLDERDALKAELESARAVVKAAEYILESFEPTSLLGQKEIAYDGNNLAEALTAHREKYQ